MIRANQEELNLQLLEACKFGDIPDMDAALQAGAEIECLGEGKKGPLHLAVEGNHYDAAVFLLARGVSPDVLDGDKHPPLKSAVIFGREEMVELLLDWGADPNFLYEPFGQSSLFKTILHIGLWNRRLVISQTLLDAGADPLVPMENSQMPEEIAERAGKPILQKIQFLSNLPRLDEQEVPITKERLFEPDEQGMRLIDNPLTWRHWEEISVALAARGEVITKEDLFTENAAGQLLVSVALKARLYQPLIEMLNAQGEYLGTQDLAGHEALKGFLESQRLVQLLFTEENMLLQGKGALRQNLKVISEDVKNSLNNLHTLTAKLQGAPSKEEVQEIS